MQIKVALALNFYILNLTKTEKKCVNLSKINLSERISNRVI